jgi:hypothetical protein
MPEEIKMPFTYKVIRGEEISLSSSDNHIVRRLSAMQNQYSDEKAYEALLVHEDHLMY